MRETKTELKKRIEILAAFAMQGAPHDAARKALHEIATGAVEADINHVIQAAVSVTERTPAQAGMHAITYWDASGTFEPGAPMWGAMDVRFADGSKLTLRAETPPPPDDLVAQTLTGLGFTLLEGDLTLDEPEVIELDDGGFFEAMSLFNQSTAATVMNSVSMLLNNLPRNGQGEEENV